MSRIVCMLAMLSIVSVLSCGESDGGGDGAGASTSGGAAGAAGSGGQTGGAGGAAAGGGAGSSGTAGDPGWPEHAKSPFTFSVDPGMPTLAGRGGIIVFDLTADGLLDYVLTAKENDFGAGRAAISAYDWSGTLLWIEDDVDLQMNGNAENHGLPGWSGPGVGAGDVDGDGAAEIVHLDTQNRVVIRDGATGVIERTLGPFALPAGASRWAHLQVVDLRGTGDRDLILQADPLPFRWLKAIRLDTAETLWDYDQYRGCNHGGFRAADIDGDGLDEVAGATLLDHDGSRLNGWDYRVISGHFDSVFMYDVRPSVAGIEVVMLEESHSGDDRSALFNAQEVFWYASRNGDEPQNAAIGKFDPGLPGLQVWNRSRFDTDQRPWVLDQDGDTIAEWVLNDVKPAGWSNKGVEQIYAIDWDGGAKQYLAAKERHTNGQVAVIDAMSGSFVQSWSEQCDRIYVVDVAGDAREEIVVVNDTAREVRVYFNDATNPNPAKPRRWSESHYARQKINYNYYSP
jgi:hypothetical protein